MRALLSFLVAVVGVVPAMAEFDQPDEYPLDRYSGLFEESPFARTVVPVIQCVGGEIMEDRFKDWVVVGFSRWGGTHRVTIANAKSGDTQTLVSGKTNSQGVRLVGVNRASRLMESIVTVHGYGSQSMLRFGTLGEVTGVREKAKAAGKIPKSAAKRAPEQEKAQKKG